MTKSFIEIIGSVLEASLAIRTELSVISREASSQSYLAHTCLASSRCYPLVSYVAVAMYLVETAPQPLVRWYIDAKHAASVLEIWTVPVAMLVVLRSGLHNGDNIGKQNG